MKKQEQVVEKIMSSLEFHIITVIRKKRTKRKKSQLQLSQAIELADGLIGKIENPKQPDKYNISHLNQVARVLNFSPKDLMPRKAFPHDKVKVTFRIYYKKNESNKLIRRYEVVKTEPILSPDKKAPKLLIKTINAR